MEPENTLSQIEAEMCKMMNEYRTPGGRTAKAIQRFICDATGLPPNEIHVDFDLGETSCTFNVQIGDDE